MTGPVPIPKKRCFPSVCSNHDRLLPISSSHRSERRCFWIRLLPFSDSSLQKVFWCVPIGDRHSTPISKTNGYFCCSSTSLRLFHKTVQTGYVVSLLQPLHIPDGGRPFTPTALTKRSVNTECTSIKLAMSIGNLIDIARLIYLSNPPSMSRLYLE